jgi:adenylate kinase
VQVIFLGLPGAGKGTQADAIREDFGIPHISTGEMFRAAQKDGSALGAEVRPYLERGLLVPDELTIRIVRDRVQQADAREGFLLDGFPRTRPQATALDEMLEDLGRPVTHVLHLDVRRDELLRRLTGRWICPSCGATYHAESLPPETPGVCDRCGAALTQRADDTPEAVRTRLEENWARTEDLVEFYRSRGLVTRIDGERPVNQVREAIRRTLRGPAL